MTFCHAALLDQALDAIAMRESVVILGRPLSGRTTLLHAIGQHLREAGHEPLVVRGVRGLDAALSSLDLSQVSAPPPKQHEATLGSAYTLLVERMRQHDQALLVDDLDDLDDTSLALLQHAAARTRVPVVATASSRGRAGGDLPFPSAMRLDMRPLSFEDCAELLADVLGGPVEAATVARLMAKTAGLPGLLVRFASSARRAGRLVERGGVWQGTSSLWSTGVARIVSGYVAGLPDDLMSAVLRLSHAGSMSLQAARELVGDDALLALEDRRLVELSASSEAGPSIALSPPLLTQYLQRDTSPLVRALTGSGDHSEESWVIGMGLGAVSAVGVAPLPTSTASLVQERLRADHHARQAAWESEPSPARARELLRVLIARGVDRREILDVIERTCLEGADDDTVVEYLTTVAQWRAWADDDLAGAIEVLEKRAADASPRVAAELDLLSSHMSSVGAETPDAVPARGERVLPEPVSLHGERLALPQAAIIEGDGARALAALEGLHVGPASEELAVARTLEIQALALTGDLREVVARSCRYRQESVAALEPFGIAMHSHTASKALFFQGRYAEAEAVLDEALAVGAPPFPYLPLHVGNLAGFAVLQARRGRFDLAEATQQQAERYGIVHSYTVLGSTAWSRAYIDALRDGDESMDALWESGLELERRGFLSAALAVWTMAVAPWSSDRLAHVRKLSDQVPGMLYRPMLTYHQALAANEPVALEGAYAELQEQGRPFFAGVAARALAAVYRHEEPKADLWRTRANDLAEEVGCAALDLAPGRSLRANVTPREQDILRLVVSGRSNAEIAASCFLSVRTVENHVHRIIRKLGVSSRAELGEVWK